MTTRSILAKQAIPKIRLWGLFAAVPLLLVAMGLYMLLFEQKVTPTARITGSLLLLVPGLLASYVVLQPLLNPFRVTRSGDDLFFSGGLRLLGRRIPVSNIRGVTRTFRESQTEGGTRVPQHACRVTTADGKMLAYRGYYARESDAFAAAIAQAARVTVEIDPSAANGRSRSEVN